MVNGPLHTDRLQKEYRAGTLNFECDDMVSDTYAKSVVKKTSQFYVLLLSFQKY